MAVKKKTKKDSGKKNIVSNHDIIENEKKEKVRSERVGEELTPRQIKFCEYYTSGDKEFFGNGVESYLEVYDIDTSKPNWYKTACVCASQLLSNPKVFNKINSMLEEAGFNDQNVEKQHLFLINQQADLRTKRGAIDSYYRLKGRFIDKHELSGLDGGPIEVKYKELSDEELKIAYENRIKTK